MEDVSDICYLQIKGKSQLEKEIVETRNIQNKVIDFQALHRNEQTHEIEGPTASELDKVSNLNTNENLLTE